MEDSRSVIVKIIYFKKNYIAILLFLSGIVLLFSGCATAPLFSNHQIIQISNGNGLKIAIQKKDIKFSSNGFSPISGKNVAIYNCIGREIYEKIPNTGILSVNNKPNNPNIIYIYNFRDATSWDVNPTGEFINGLFIIPALFGSRITKTIFKGDVLINGKNYTIKAHSSYTQSDMTAYTHKLLMKTCSNFTEKLKELILQTNLYSQKKRNHKIFYYSSQNSLSPIYADNDPNFKKFALYVYKTSSPYIYSNEKYIYNAIPVTSTLSDCRIISVIRKINGNSKHNQRNIENYKICKGNIFETESSNMANWDKLPENIKPIINEVYNETREYGKANANHKGYTIIGKADVKGKSVNLYVLKGILLEAIIKK